MSTEDVQRQLDQVIAYIEQHPLDNTAQEAATSKLLDTIRGSDQELMREIIALAQHALDIEKTMRAINDLFGQIALGDVSQNLKKDVQDLKTKWAVLLTRYINLLWESRRVSVLAQGVADAFVHDLLTFLLNDDIPIDEKKQEIQNFLERIAGDESRATSMAVGFQTFQQDVQSFQEKWSAIVKKYNLASVSTTGQEWQTVHVSELSVTLQSLNQKVNQFASALGVYSTTLAVADVYIKLFPMFWANALLTAIGTEGQYADIVQQTQDVYNHLKTETEVKRDIDRSSANSDNGVIEQLRRGFAGFRKDFSSTSTRLLAFVQVWALLRSDIQAIEEKLELIHKTPSEKLIKLRVVVVGALYESLGKAFRQYQLSIPADAAIFQGKSSLQ